MTPKHFVLVSLGSIGLRHLKNLRYLYPDAQITVVRRTNKAPHADERLATNIVSSVDEAIKISPPTACFISSPSPFHLSDAREFLTINCPVFIEKPLSHSSSEVQKFIEIAEETKTICMVAYVLRFLPTMRRIKKIIVQKKYGNIIHASVSVGQYLPDWRPDQDFRQTVSAQKSLGGGALLELSHEIDYALHLFGLPEKIHSHIQSTGTLDIDVEDQADSSFYYKSGMVVNLHMDFLQKVPSRYCHIIMEKGFIKWDFITGELTIGSKDQSTIIEEVSLVSNDTYLSEIKYFLTCIDNQNIPCVGLVDGLNVLQVIDAMHQSSLTNTTVNFTTN